MCTFIFRDKKLPVNKELRSSINKIYGVGLNKAKFICSKLGFAYPFNSKELNVYQKGLITGLLNNCLIGDVKAKRTSAVQITLLKELNTVKGRKHASGLPVRGQRIRSNGQTQKRIFGRIKTTILKTQTPMGDAFWRKKSAWKRRGKPYKRKKMNMNIKK